MSMHAARVEELPIRMRVYERRCRMRERELRSAGSEGRGERPERAANIGAQGAAAPWLLIVNPDVRWCEPGALDIR